MAGNMQHFIVRSENYQNVTQRYEVSRGYWKNDTNRLIQCKVATNLQFLKNAMSAKNNKTKYAYTLVQSSEDYKVFYQQHLLFRGNLKRC